MKRKQLQLCGSMELVLDHPVFLVAKLLYKYLFPSVRMSVCLSVRFRGKRDFLGPLLRWRSDFFELRYLWMLSSLFLVYRSNRLVSE